MKSLVEELLEYFNNTPEEVLKKDWEEIHSEYGYGLEVQKFIEESKKLLFNNVTIVSKIKVEPSISDEFGKDINLAMAA